MRIQYVPTPLFEGVFATVRIRAGILCSSRRPLEYAMYVFNGTRHVRAVNIVDCNAALDESVARQVTPVFRTQPVTQRYHLCVKVVAIFGYVWVHYPFEHFGWSVARHT